jgi:hypothetical protein
MPLSLIRPLPRLYRTRLSLGVENQRHKTLIILGYYGFAKVLPKKPRSPLKSEKASRLTLKENVMSLKHPRSDFRPSEEDYFHRIEVELIEEIRRREKAKAEEKARLAAQQEEEVQTQEKPRTAA